MDFVGAFLNRKQILLDLSRNKQAIAVAALQKLTKRNGTRAIGKRSLSNSVPLVNVF